MAELTPPSPPQQRLGLVTPLKPSTPSALPATPKLVNTITPAPILKAPKAPKSENKVSLGEKPKESKLTISNIPNQAFVNAKSFAKLAQGAPMGAIKFFGGIGVDAGQNLLAGVTNAVTFGHGYDAPKVNTLTHMVDSFKRTFTVWDRLPEYYRRLNNAEEITSLVIEDASNVFIVTAPLAKIFRAGAASAAEGAAAQGAKAATIGAEIDAKIAAGSTLEEASLKTLAEQAQKSANRADVLNARANRFNKFAEASNQVKLYSDKMGMLPIKPYFIAGSKIGAAVRQGVYVEGIIGWGRAGEKGYRAEIDALVAQNPNIDIKSPEMENLLNKLKRSQRLGMSPLAKARVNEANRMITHERELVTQAVQGEMTNPKFKGEVDPVTNEKYGDLTPAEQQAVIAVLNGRGQLINWMVNVLKKAPEEISKLGRYDANPEYYLSPEGSRLAYEFLNPQNKTISDMQYERLSSAVENVARASHAAGQKSIAGFGRKTRLAPEYAIPLPFVNSLERAVMKYGSDDLKELWAEQKEAGLFDLDINDPNRQRFIQAVVEQLPDEVALDASMYPATMRENIEFYKRVRRSLNREVTGEATKNPIPPYDGSPRSPEGFNMTVGGGKLTAAENLLGAAKLTVEKIKAKIEKIYVDIADLEVRHQKLTEKIDKYTIVEEYISGRSIQSLARKYYKSTVEISDIISGNSAGSAFKQSLEVKAKMDELQKTIGVKRASLKGAERDAELIKLEEDLATYTKEAEALQRRVEAARSLDQIAKQADLNAIDKIAEDLYNKHDEVADAEDDLDRAGGDPTNIWREGDPINEEFSVVTAAMGQASLKSIVDLIDGTLSSLEGIDKDILGRSKQVLESAWSKAENDYFNANHPDLLEPTTARLTQMATYLQAVVDKLNILTDTPSEIPLEQRITKVIYDTVNNKTDQAILAGSAPLDMVIRSGTPGATPYERGNRPAFDPAVWQEFTDEDGYIDFENILTQYSRTDIYGKKLNGYFEKITETFEDPSGIQSPQIFTPWGDIARMSEGVSQIIRWVNEVRAATTDNARIKAILKKPEYMSEELYKRMTQGVSRYDIEKIERRSPNHPLAKFEKKVPEVLNPLLREIFRIEKQLENFGKITQTEWRRADFASVQTPRMNLDYAKVIIFFKDLKPRAGQQYITQPKLTFDAHVPIESVLEALDALEKAIEQDAGVNSLRVGDFVERKSAWPVGIEGLAKSEIGRKNISLEELRRIRSEVSKLKQIETPSKFRNPNLLPGVKIKPPVPAYMDSPFTKKDIERTALYLADLADELQSQIDEYLEDGYDVDDEMATLRSYELAIERLDKSQKDGYLDVTEMSKNDIYELKNALEESSMAIDEGAFQNYMDFLDYQQENNVVLTAASREIIAPEVQPVIPPEGQKLAPVTKKVINGKNVDYVVIPCGAEKLTIAAKASEMYVGSMFKDALNTARGVVPDENIYVLSAKYGLLRLDQVIEPYDIKFGKPGTISSESIGEQITQFIPAGSNVLSLLPTEYHTAFSGSAGELAIDRAFDGTKGIGQQKGRLKNIRDEAATQGNLTPVAVVEQQLHPGSVELIPELEPLAKQAAEDSEIFFEMQAEYQDRKLLEDSIREIENPTIEDLAAFRDEQAQTYVQQVETFSGSAETNLGAKWDRGTGKVTWNLSPKKGAPEWEWWYSLSGKERSTIARDFFSSEAATLKSVKGTKTTRISTGIDVYADQANMSVEEFADAMMQHITEIRNLRKLATEALTADPATLRQEYISTNGQQLYNYIEDMGSTTAKEYAEIITRAEYLAGDPPSIMSDFVAPLPDNPELVQFDRTLINPDVRRAAYEKDFVDSMAKDAAKKMRQAERATDRLQAFQEFLDLSKKHDGMMAYIEERKRIHNKARLAQFRNEQKQAAKRLQIANLKKKLKGTKFIEGSIEKNPATELINQMPGNIPLQVAMSGGYPSEQFSYLVPALGDAPEYSQPLVGPMYLPTGRPGQRSDGLRTVITREGMDGFKKASSEHYRDGDRHTIFSIRLIGKRLGADVGRWTANDRFSALVSTFGETPKESIGEGRAMELYQQAIDIASNMPLQEQEAAGYFNMLEDGTIVENIDGTASYSQGVPNPKAVFDAAVRETYGKLIVREMALRGRAPIDPFNALTSTIRLGQITHETMFVPVGFREMIAQTEKVFDPAAMGGIYKSFTKVQGFFKTTTLAFSHMWQLGDTVSNFIIADMTGVDVPTMIKRIKEVRKAEYGTGKGSILKLIDPASELPPPTEFGKLLQEAPVQDISMSSEQRRIREGLPAELPKEPLLNRISRGVSKKTGYGREISYPKIGQGRGALKWGFKINESINRLQRHAYFAEILDRRLRELGKTLDEVAADGSWRYDAATKEALYASADTANKWLGDFSNLSRFERATIMPVIPFYAWIKHINKVFIALGKEHPQSLRWYITFGLLSSDAEKDPFGIRYGGTSMFGGTVSTNFMNPIADVVDAGFGAYILEGDPKPLLNSFGPVPRLTTGLLFGKDLPNFKDLTRPPGTGDYTAAGQAQYTPLLRPGRLTEAAGYTIQQFPLIQRIQNIIPGENIPGTKLALGPVTRYQTGEARIDPRTGKRITKWGGELASIARLFSIPFIPGQTDQQVADLQRAAVIRLHNVDMMKYKASLRNP